MAGDVIRDFTAGDDRIDLSAIDAVAGGRDTAFVFGGAEFRGGGKPARDRTANPDACQGDLDGNGTRRISL